MSMKSAQISNILGWEARCLPAAAVPDATEHGDLSLSAHEGGFAFFPSPFLSFSFNTTGIIFILFLVGYFISWI